MSDRSAPDAPHALVALMKGVVEREATPTIWHALLANQSRVRDHFAIVGLELIVDEAEGFAYLRQRRANDEETDLPRLIVRRQLSYPVSLMLVLLRKTLAETDATGGDGRAIVTKADILDMIRLFLPDANNQAKFEERIDRDIAKVVELGFLRSLNARENTYEVRRILRSFVDAQWLSDFDERLSGYAAHGGKDSPIDAGAANE